MRAEILFAIFCVFGVGCAETEQPKIAHEQQEHEIPDVKVHEAEFRLNGAGEGPVRVRTDEAIRVAGQFKLTDPTQAPTPLVIHVKKTGARLGGSFTSGVATKGDVVTFDTEITAPSKPGNYSIEVVEGRTTIATRSMTVSPR